MRAHPRRAAKRDSNEKPLVNELRRLGYEVERGAWVDLVVWRPRENWVALLEVKTERGHMTPTQTDLIARGCPIAIVRNLAEAIAAIDAVGG